MIQSLPWMDQPTDTNVHIIAANLLCIISKPVLYVWMCVHVCVSARVCVIVHIQLTYSGIKEESCGNVNGNVADVPENYIKMPCMAQYRICYQSITIQHPAKHMLTMFSRGSYTKNAFQNVWKLENENLWKECLGIFEYTSRMFLQVLCLHPWLVDKIIIDIYVMIYIYMFIIIWKKLLILHLSVVCRK